MQGALNQEAVLQNYFDVLLVGVGELEALMDGGVAAPPAAPASAESAAAGETAGGATALPRFCHIQPFNVVGLRLAIARAAVRAVLAWDGGALPASAQGPGWVWGTLRTSGGTVKVIDTAALVVPAEHPQRAAILERRRYSHILLLEGGEVGLACDGVDEDILVPLDHIRWRDATGTHAWLGGTVSDYGYALMDIRRVMDLLALRQG